MSLPRTEFVAIDLASLVLQEPTAVRRCLENAARVCETEGGPADPRALRRLAGAVDRVLAAHFTCDPDVDTLPGARFLLERLQRRGVAVIAVARFGAPVVRALVRRFGWDTCDVILAQSPDEEIPLWSVALEAAETCGVDPDAGAFLSDDGFEVACAARRGCRRPIVLGARARETVGLDVAASETLSGVLGLLEPTTGPAGHGDTLSFGHRVFEASLTAAADVFAVPDAPASGARLILHGESLF
jgi:hypothetical protein